MSSNPNNSSNDDLMSWFVIILAFIFFWPVGLFLLFRKLSEEPSSPRTSKHPYDLQTAKKPGAQGVQQSSRRPQPRAAQARRPRVPGRMSNGTALTVWGAILAAIFGMGSFVLAVPVLFYDIWPVLIPLMPCLGLTVGGLSMIAIGRGQARRAKRCRKYLSLIGSQQEISVSSLAHAMPVSVSTACNDLQEMLDRGVLPTGYLDMRTGQLILNSDGLREERFQAPEPPAPEPEPEEEAWDADAMLAEIRHVNQAIADPTMSQKIDRIGEITGKIFAYQRQNPNRAGQLSSFLNYYLPTTLRILRAYAQMEAQGINGENIRSAKSRIEGMMDKVVEGYEKQLDMLFQNDAMDITTDVEVLERMLEKDGLAGGGLTLKF